MHCERLLVRNAVADVMKSEFHLGSVNRVNDNLQLFRSHYD